MKELLFIVFLLLACVVMAFFVTIMRTCTIWQQLCFGIPTGIVSVVYFGMAWMFRPWHVNETEKR